MLVCYKSILIYSCGANVITYCCCYYYYCCNYYCYYYCWWLNASALYHSHLERARWNCSLVWEASAWGLAQRCVRSCRHGLHINGSIKATSEQTPKLWSWRLKSRPSTPGQWHTRSTTLCKIPDASCASIMQRPWDISPAAAASSQRSSTWRDTTMWPQSYTGLYVLRRSWAQ